MAKISELSRAYKNALSTDNANEKAKLLITSLQKLEENNIKTSDYYSAARILMPDIADCKVNEQRLMLTLYCLLKCVHNYIANKDESCRSTSVGALTLFIIFISEHFDWLKKELLKSSFNINEGEAENLTKELLIFCYWEYEHATITTSNYETNERVRAHFHYVQNKDIMDRLSNAKEKYQLFLDYDMDISDYKKTAYNIFKSITDLLTYLENQLT